MIFFSCKHSYILILSVLLWNWGDAEQVFTFETCSASQTLDLGSLTCEDCTSISPSFRPLASTDILGNAAGCTCPAGQLTQSTCNPLRGSPALCTAPACVSCSTGTIESSFAGCKPCGNSTGGIGTDGASCICPSGSVAVEVSASGAELSEFACTPCPARAQKVAWNTCASCVDKKMTRQPDGRCVCDAGTVQLGVASLGAQSCIVAEKIAPIAAQFPEAQATALTFQVSKLRQTSGAVTSTISSASFRHLYLRAAAACYHYETTSDQWGCQTLANLCVLQLHGQNVMVSVLFAVLSPMLISGEGLPPLRLDHVDSAIGNPRVH